MSSFVGHGLAGFYIYASEKRPASTIGKRCWLIWLIIIACFPDIDYAFPSLRFLSSSEQIVRITHSILFSLLLPIITIILLVIGRYKRINILNNHLNNQDNHSLIIHSRQAIFAGLSHITLDFLVGVMPLPLFYPFITETFKFSFGILPSAGRLSLTNYYFYRNLFIELGILIPLFYSIYLISHQRVKTRLAKVKISCFLLISTCFLFWSASLSR